jgi:hypothetical protein
MPGTIAILDYLWSDILLTFAYFCLQDTSRLRCSSSVDNQESGRNVGLTCAVASVRAKINLPKLNSPCVWAFLTGHLLGIPTPQTRLIENWGAS